MSKTLSARTQKVQDSIRKPRLTYPYLGAMHLLKATYEEQTSGSGTNAKSWKNLILTFECHGDMDRPDGLGMTPKGVIYPHTIFRFNEKTKLDNARETIDQLWYIFKHIVGNKRSKVLTDFSYSGSEDKLEADFDAYADGIIEKLNKWCKNDWSNWAQRPILTKIGGYVKRQSGEKPKTYLRWPSSFAGYITEMNGIMQFDTGEMENNADFIDYIQKKNAAGNRGGSSSAPAASGGAAATAAAAEEDEDMDDLGF